MSMISLVYCLQTGTRLKHHKVKPNQPSGLAELRRQGIEFRESKAARILGTVTREELADWRGYLLTAENAP